jgi:hypothetical protein
MLTDLASLTCEGPKVEPSGWFPTHSAQLVHLRANNKINNNNNNNDNDDDNNNNNATFVPVLLLTEHHTMKTY